MFVILLVLLYQSFTVLKWWAWVSKWLFSRSATAPEWNVWTSSWRSSLQHIWWSQELASVIGEGKCANWNHRQETRGPWISESSFSFIPVYNQAFKICRCSEGIQANIAQKTSWPILIFFKVNIKSNYSYSSTAQWHHSSLSVDMLGEKHIGRKLVYANKFSILGFETLFTLNHSDTL